MKNKSLFFAATRLLLFSSLTLWVSQVYAASAWGPMSQIESAARNEGKLVIYAAPGHANRKAQRAI
ncbi:MAG: hypothetical protein GTO40_29000, partial [Deltaproteobacteria bacterium]|nr:hypothetical protein [Deltaproteobacteria bacterium]